MSLLTNLVSYYKMDAASGNESDSQGTNTATDNGSCGSTTGVINTSRTFNGSTQYFDLADPASLKLTGSMSISVWIYPTADGHILSKRGFGGSRAAYLSFSNIDFSTREIIFSISSDGTNEAARESTTAIITKNTFNHVVAIYDATAQTLDIYINGTLRNGTLTGTVPASQFTNNGSNWNIGRRPTGDTFASCRIDELGIWSRELSSAEVTQLYNSGNGFAYPFTVASSVASKLSIFSGTRLNVLSGTRLTLVSF